LSADNGEGHDHTVADLQVGDFGSTLDHLSQVLLAEDVAALHGRLVAVKEMKVRAADSTCGDLDDRVARVVDLRIRNRVHPDVTFSVPAQRARMISFLQMPAPTGEIAKRSRGRTRVGATPSHSFDRGWLAQAPP
jgi:hypothetical protein